MSMGPIGTLDVRKFLGSPRHGHFFRESADAREKIRRRWEELRSSGRIRGKTPIVNIQESLEIVELHDGNASAVAWLLHAGERGIAPILDHFRESFDRVIILRNRLHDSGDVWHPYVPPEVRSADRLAVVIDPEQSSREVRKAMTPEGEAVHFNDTDFFSGDDTAEPLGSMADDFVRAMR
jgi:hypothetical protein